MKLIYFVLPMVILCLFPTRAFAEQNLRLITLPDGQIRLASVWPARQNGIISAKVMGGNYVHGTAESLGLRSATSGAVSSAKVPATITQSVPKSNLAKGLLGNLRRLRGGLPGIAFQLLSPLLLQEGYEWIEEQQDYVKRGQANSACLSVKALSAPNSDYLTFDQCLTYDDHIVTKPDNTSLANACNEIGIRQRYVSGAVSYSASRNGSCSHGSQVLALVRLSIEYYPITDADMERILDQVPTEKVGELLPAAADPVTGTIPGTTVKVHVLAGTIVNSHPYTDPADGKAKQMRWEFYDCDTDQSCVRTVIVERPDLEPNSPAAPLPDNSPDGTADTAPDNGNQTDNLPGSETNSDQPPPFDLCKEHPEILACQQMGQPDPGQFDDIKIPVVVDDTTWQEDVFLPSTGVCPEPKTFHVMGKPFQISYQPLCKLMESIRFMVLIAFILMSAYVCFGSLRRE